MHIHSISLRGFIGISRGLGVDEIALDLAGLRGVIALCGTNGSAKSTVLENLQPWRWLPSREIGLKDAVQLRNSHKDLIFDVNGHLVRAKATVDAVNGKSDGHVWIDDQPKTSGKISEMDEVLEALIGSQELFFHSVFAAQTAKSLLSLRPAQRKDFFVEFLGLGRLQEYSERAKKVADFIDAMMTGWKQSSAGLAQEAGKLADHEAKLGELRESIARGEPAIAAKRQAISALEDELRTMEVKQGDVIGIRRTIERLQNQRRQLVSEMGTRTANLGRSIRQAEQTVGRLETDIRSHESEIEKLTRQGSVFSADEEARLDEQLLVVEGKLADQRALDLQIHNTTVEHMGKIQKLDGEIEQAKKIAVLATKIPAAAPRDICSDCGFAQAALHAQRGLPAIQTQRTEAQAAYDAVIGPLRRRLNGTGLIEQELELKAKLREAKQSRERSTAIDRCRLLRDTAALQLPDARTQLQQLEEELATAIEVHDEKLKTVDAEIQTETAKLDAAQLDQLLTEKRAEIQREKTWLQKATQGLESLRVNVGVLERDCERSRQAQLDLDNLQVKLVAADHERAEWVLLYQICGRDKLQALELDAAAPAITSLANHLLSECFGGRFSVHFVTMDEAGREVFDVRVTDIRGGGQESLTLKSGGEKVVVLHALRLAIVMYAKERSGRDFKTLFLDEVDGALAPEVRSTFIDMNRAAMRVGQFDTLFLVSHSTEILDCCDHSIVFADGKIDIK